MAMRRGRRQSSYWGWILVVLLGLFVGSWLGSYLSRWLPFLTTSIEIGNTAPLIINSSVLDLTFKLLVRFNLGSLVGLLLAVLIYRRLS
ncbi:MAG: DUF4321 domain-containing protein [Bacillota bacterium]